VVLGDPPQFNRLEQRGELRGRKVGLCHSGGEQRHMALMRPAKEKADVILDGEAGNGVSDGVGRSFGD
jgi:hypothetical protein